MNKLLPLLILALLLFSCKSGGVTREQGEYKARIGKKGAIYLTAKNWTVYTDRKKCPENILALIERLEQEGYKIPLFGFTKDYSCGLRIISEPTDIDLNQYFKIVKKVNGEALGEHSEPSKININGREALLWDYQVKDKNLKFIEVMLSEADSKLRVTIWTSNELFEERYLEFMEIINSIR